MNWKCRIGLHDWKPVARYHWGVKYTPHLPPWFNVYALRSYFHQTGHKCRRCGKRVTL